MAAMYNNRVGSMLVHDDKDIVGMVTERDCIRRVSLKGKRTRSTLTRDVMTPKLYTMSLDTSGKDPTSVGQVVEMMMQRGCRHIPVVEPSSASPDGSPVGRINSDSLISVVSLRYLVMEISARLREGKLDRTQRPWCDSMLAVAGAKSLKEIVTVEPTDTVYTTLERMSEFETGAAVVMDGTKICGIVTERDYVSKVVLKQAMRSKETEVRAIMTPAPLEEVPPELHLADALELIAAQGIRHLPVILRISGGSVLHTLEYASLLSHRDLVSLIYNFLSQGQYKKA